MRFTRTIQAASLIAAAVALTSLSCGEKSFEYDTNLLTNGSFEKVGGDGIPEGWELASFRGLTGEQEVEYTVDGSVATDGNNSWRFRGDPGTRRWHVLTQEVEVPDITHVRLSGWMQIDQVDRKKDQYAQCNFLLTFYDENHHRFQEMRFADKRTRLKVGSALWFQENQVFRVPDGTRYVAVSCILGMDGTVWFDDVSLSVPEPLDWLTYRTRNFEFHWFPERPFPPGSMENQQHIFDDYERRLGVESDVVVKYYLYPDTASIRRILSLKGFQYVSWDDREFHSINPNDDHEVVHFITDDYGKPPRSVAEGTVFWLQDNWGGYPIQKVAAYRLSNGNLAPLEVMTNYNQFVMQDPNVTLPCMASFVGYVAERFGVDKLMELYKESSGANSYGAFAAALEKVYDIPASDLEQQWQLALKRVDISDLPKAGQAGDAQQHHKDDGHGH